MTLPQDLDRLVRDRLREPDGLPPPRLAEMGPLVHQTAQEHGFRPRFDQGRFQTMFSATKFLVAGAILALFGGFLLSGVLPQPSEGLLPPAAPTQTASPEPETVEESVRSDILPGGDLEVERVATGIYRVLSDGHTDLRGNVWEVAAEDDGDVWVLKHRVTYEPKERRPEELRVRYRDARLMVLGEPAPRFKGPKRSNRPSRLSIVDGQIRLDGRAWTEIGWRGVDPECYGKVLDGGCWSSHWEPRGIRRTDLVAGGRERLFTSEDVGVSPERVLGSSFTLDGQGNVWATIGDSREQLGPNAQLTGLASWDGTTWETHVADTPVPGHPTQLLVSSDGSVWVVTEGYRENGRTNWIGHWDGSTWSTVGQAELPRARFTPVHLINESPDGTVWFGPLHYWDGSQLREVELPGTRFSDRSSVESYSFAPDGSVWAVISQPSGDPKDPREQSCAQDARRCQSEPGLYVIIPEAMAADE